MTSSTKWPADFLGLLAKVTNRRAKIVIEHILKNGSITTEDLEKTYGYNHPPRAVRDVRDQGIPIITERTKSASGRSIAVYRFGNPADVRQGRLGGRRAFSKAFKLDIAGHEPKCGICGTPYELRYLQIDHRVPYEIAGDSQDTLVTTDYMLLCLSCQRAKSWSCEHCQNWISGRLPEICRRCYWANPESHEHIALQEIRRVDIVWLGESEIAQYESLRQLAVRQKVAVPIYAKKALNDHVVNSSRS